MTPKPLLCQAVFAVPEIYGVELPEVRNYSRHTPYPELHPLILATPPHPGATPPFQEYDQWMSWLTWIKFDWSRWIIPGNCVGEYGSRVAVQAGLPLLLMVLLLLAGPLIKSGRVVWSGVNRSRMRSLWLDGLSSTLPVVLFFAYCVTVSVSRAIFAAWTCDHYVIDSEMGTEQSCAPLPHAPSLDLLRPLLNRCRLMVTDLRADPSVVCSSDEHRKVEQVALVFVVI